jgi:hypothetical protein
LRPLAWFKNDDWDPPRRLLLPFSTSLLEEGISGLQTRGMISIRRVTRNPRDRRRLPRPRNIYQDRLDRFDAQVSQFDFLTDVLFELDAEGAAAPVQNPRSAADVVIDGGAEAQARRAPPARSPKRSR